MKTYIFTLSLIFCLCSCSSNSEVDPNSTFISPVPISEIQERLPLSVEESIDKITRVLERHLLEIQDGFTADYKFSTNSVKIKDKMCSGQFLKDAPLPCDIKFHGVLIPNSENVTTLRLMYEENCVDQTHIPSICKDSNAEKLLFTLIKEIK